MSAGTVRADVVRPPVPTFDRRSRLQAVYQEDILKKCLSLVFALLLAMAAPAMAASQTDGAQAAPQNRIEQLTGKAWLASSQEARVALLCGIELALNVEKMGTDMANAEIAKNPRATKSDFEEVSPFAQAWYKAFATVPLRDIAAQIDAWYAAHPGQEDRLVLAVIWVELMKQPVPAAKQ